MIFCKSNNLNYICNHLFLLKKYPIELIGAVETEKVGNEVVLSEYELERGKPMPNLTHGSLQAKYRIASEVALATDEPTGTTPDIVFYPSRELNFINEVSK